MDLSEKELILIGQRPYRKDGKLMYGFSEDDLNCFFHVTYKSVKYCREATYQDVLENYNPSRTENNRYQRLADINRLAKKNALD